MRLTSTCLPNSETFRTNRAAHLAMLETVRTAAEAAGAGGGPEAVARHTGRGKMAPRERVAGLLDPGSAFLEIGATAAGPFEASTGGPGDFGGDCGAGISVWTTTSSPDAGRLPVFLTKASAVL